MCIHVLLLCLFAYIVVYVCIQYDILQWWQKESGPSGILSKKEQTRVKRPNKSRKTVNLYLKYNMFKRFCSSNLNIPFWNFRYAN